MIPPEDLPEQVHLFGLMCALRFRNGLKRIRTGEDGTTSSRISMAEMVVAMSQRARWRGGVLPTTLSGAVCRGIGWACRYTVNEFCSAEDARYQRRRYYTAIFDEGAAERL